MADLTWPGVVAGLVSFGKTVTGIVGSYGGATLREQLDPTILPCLQVIPPDDGQLDRNGAMGLNGVIRARLTHALFYWPKGSTRKPLPETMPALDQLFWNYALALKALPYLTPANAPSLHYAAKPTFKFGELTWQKKKYDGIQFIYNVEFNY